MAVGIAQAGWSRRGVLLGAGAALAGCDGFPRDSGGALDRITRDRRVRVGAVDHSPWVRLAGDGVGGLEAELVRAWAATLGAAVVWRAGALDPLSEALHGRELDLLIAGFDEKTPYAPKLALTQPYLSARVDGRDTKRVLAVQPGENALLMSLDTFLLAQDGTALRRRAGVPA